MFFMPLEMHESQARILGGIADIFSVKRLHFAVLLLIFICLRSHGQTFLHSETNSGDLGEDHLAPTTLSLSQGVSFLEVSVNRFDVDVFTLTIPAGIQLNAIILRNYGSTSANQSFFGFQEHRLTLSTFPSSGFGDPINYVLVGTDDLNSDVLSVMVNANVNLAGPLQAGNHAFWVNETSDNQANMIFEFQSSQVTVPEATSSLLLLIGAGCFTLRRHRFTC